MARTLEHGSAQWREMARGDRRRPTEPMPEDEEIAGLLEDKEWDRAILSFEAGSDLNYYLEASPSANGRR